METIKIKQETVLNLLDCYLNDKWITIHPHGEDSEDYRRIKLEDDETPKEAIERVYKKDDKDRDKNGLKKEDTETLKKTLENYKKYGTRYSDIIEKIEKELKSREPKKTKQELQKIKESEIKQITDDINEVLKVSRPDLHFVYNKNHTRPYQLWYKEQKRYSLNNVNISSDKVSKILKHLLPQIPLDKEISGILDRKIAKQITDKINYYEEKEQ